MAPGRLMWRHLRRHLVRTLWAGITVRGVRGVGTMVPSPSKGGLYDEESPLFQGFPGWIGETHASPRLLGKHMLWRMTVWNSPSPSAPWWHLACSVVGGFQPISRNKWIHMVEFSLPAYRPYKHIYMIDMCALICPFCLLFFSHTCATDASYCCLPGSLHTDT